MDELTKHAQFANLGWFVTYMGAVSYIKLVSTTDTASAATLSNS
jgi:uncharacterized protein (DUF2342 family)